MQDRHLSAEPEAEVPGRGVTQRSTWLVIDDLEDQGWLGELPGGAQYLETQAVVTGTFAAGTGVLSKPDHPLDLVLAGAAA
jgi:hypothetical protein